MNLLEQLQKLSTSSAALRVSHLNKESGIAGTIGRAVLKNPLGVGLGAMTASQIPGAAKAAYKSSKVGFDPKVHKKTLGMES